MMKMHDFPHSSFFPVCRILFITCCLAGLLCASTMAADISIEAELGDTLNLHGESYVGNSVYLFLTGPGLPENGVTLMDTSQRADQGHFTIVDLDNNQQWSMKWNTARIENEIDPGTYIVYVSNEPVDKANLGGSGSYKTLEVYLKESTTSRVSVDSGTTYMLNPEMHTSVESPVIAIATPTPTPTTPLSSPPTTLPTTLPLTTRALLPTFLTVLAAIIGTGVFLSLKKG
jgi:hypothetical protein